MRVHRIQTGTVVIKAAQHSLRGPDKLRFVAVVLGRAFTSALPINTWLIEHSDGLVMVDTGELAAASDASFFANDRDYRLITRYAHTPRFQINREDELGAQLKRMGIDSKKDVRKVVLTHLHSDHADGLRFFPNAEICIARPEFARTHAAFPTTWPIWFRPSLFDFDAAPYGAFNQSHALTDDGTVFAVPTPGHTFGHTSVIVRGDPDIMLAGDASYSESQLLRGEPAGTVADVALARSTLATIRQHLAQTPSVYLPSHDPDAGARLERLQITAGV